MANLWSLSRNYRNKMRKLLHNSNQNKVDCKLYEP